MKKKVLFLILAIALFSSVASAQLSTQATANVTVQVTQENTLQLSTTGGNLVFNPSTGVSNSINLSLFYSLDSTFHVVNLYAYFASPTAMSTTGGSTIAASSVASTWTTSTGESSGSNQSCGGGAINASATCPVMQWASVAGGTLNAGGNPATITATFNLSLLNYAGLHLSAGNFQGTISFVVSAT